MRLSGIDFLRGIAVSAVVIYHFFIILNLNSNPLFPYILSFGLFGVSLFFIISGYLIYRSVDYSISNMGLKSGLKHYFLHRVFRIVPAYYFNFFVVLIMASFVINENYLYSFGFFKNVLSHLTFVSYFVYQDSGLGINGAYWTLSIEALWYVVAPLLFIYIKKDIYLLFLFFFSIFYLLGLDYSLYDSFFHLDKSASNYMILNYFFSFQLPGQLIYFITGIFIYKYLKTSLNISVLWKYIVAVSTIIIFIYVTSNYNLDTNFTINNLFILLIVSIIFILLYNVKHFKWMFAVEWIGKISFSVYLWHMPLLYIMKHTLVLQKLSLGWVALLFVLLLIIISSFSYYFIEETGFYIRKKIERFKKT